MPRRSSLTIQGTVADAFKRAALQLGLNPAEPITLAEATDLAQVATGRMTADNRRRWSRVFLEPFLHNNGTVIQTAVDQVAAHERADADRLKRGS